MAQWLQALLRSIRQATTLMFEAPPAILLTVRLGQKLDNAGVPLADIGCWTGTTPKSICTQPGQWLILCDSKSHANALERLNSWITKQKVTALATDATGGVMLHRLEAVHAQDFLSATVRMDTAKLGANSAVATLMGEIHVQLIRDQDDWLILFQRQYSDYLHHLLDRFIPS
jgi:heterotetrameric sarcosine oxidase gamma subunit